MTDLERIWFEAGRRARQELGLAPPPSFYALLGAAVRHQHASKENGAEAATPRPRGTTHERPSSREKAITHETT